jgi:hypothetical protein
VVALAAWRTETEIENVMVDTPQTMQAALDALRAAYRSGATSVSYDGKNVAYRSAADMQAAILSLENQLGQNTIPKRVVVRTNKGW